MMHLLILRQLSLQLLRQLLRHFLRQRPRQLLLILRQLLERRPPLLLLIVPILSRALPQTVAVHDSHCIWLITWDCSWARLPLGIFTERPKALQSPSC